MQAFLAIQILFLVEILADRDYGVNTVTTTECRINFSPFPTVGGCCTYSMHAVPDPAGLKAQVDNLPKEVQEIDEEDGKEIELDLDIDDVDDMYVYWIASIAMDRLYHASVLNSVHSVRWHRSAKLYPISTARVINRKIMNCD